jgi:hypothetical protein
MKRSVRNGLAIATMSGGLLFLGQSVAGADDALPEPLPAAGVAVIEEAPPLEGLEGKASEPIEDETPAPEPIEDETPAPEPIEEETPAPEPIEGESSVLDAAEAQPAALSTERRGSEPRDEERGKDGEKWESCEVARGFAGNNCPEEEPRECNGNQNPSAVQSFGGEKDCNEPPRDGCQWEPDKNQRMSGEWNKDCHEYDNCDREKNGQQQRMGSGKDCHEYDNCEWKNEPTRYSGEKNRDCKDRHDYCDRDKKSDHGDEWNRHSYKGDSKHGDKDRDCRKPHNYCDGDKKSNHGDEWNRHSYKGDSKHGDKDRDCRKPHDTCKTYGHHGKYDHGKYRHDGKHGYKHGDKHGDKQYDRDCHKPAHHAPKAPHAAPAAPVVMTVHVAPTQHVAKTASASPKTLAYTGSDVSLPLTVGLVALGLGSALSLAGRRRERTTV